MTSVIVKNKQQGLQIGIIGANISQEIFLVLFTTDTQLSQDHRSFVLYQFKNKEMSNTNLTSIRIITADIKRLVMFFESATGSTAKWSTDDFAEITSKSFTLAIGSTRTLSFFGGAIAEPAANRSIIIEFLVENVDDEYLKIKELTNEIIQEPTTMPWGNRSLLFRDPDGNLVNFFTPLSDEAKEKFR